MKKYLVLIAMFSACSMASAAVTTIIGFGTDGATGMSIPSENSKVQASSIYNALNVQQDGRKKVIEGENFGVESQADGFSLALMDTNHQITFNKSGTSGNVVIQTNRGDVVFTGPAADALFKALNIEARVLVGASTKQVANLSCARIVVAKPVVKCTLADVTWLSLKM